MEIPQLVSGTVPGLAMRWDEAPLFEGLWITRMPADHAWSTITKVDEMKWMRWVWRNDGMKFVAGENWKNPEKNLFKLSFVHHETQYGVTETRNQDPSDWRRGCNCFRHGTITPSNTLDFFFFRGTLGVKEVLQSSKNSISIFFYDFWFYITPRV